METCIEKLEKVSAEIDKLFAAITDEENETKVVMDGIMDIPKYCSSKYKILWVLKEANDPDGGWDVRKGLLKSIITSNGITKEARPTYLPIIYTSYGILNDKNWDCIPDLDKNDQSVAGIIEYVGIVNVKKLPGSSKANPEKLKEAYDQHGNIVLKQIKEYDPDIIICGYTLTDYLINGLGLKEENAVQLSDIKCYLQNDKIYIRVYHPSSLWGNDNIKEYVDGIINAVRAWKEMKNK